MTVGKREAQMRYLNLLIWIVTWGTIAAASQITEGTSTLPAALLPAFKDFEITTSLKGKLAAVSLVRPEERRFRTVLSEGELNEARTLRGTTRLSNGVAGRSAGRQRSSTQKRATSTLHPVQIPMVNSRLLGCIS